MHQFGAVFVVKVSDRHIGKPVTVNLTSFNVSSEVVALATCFVYFLALTTSDYVRISETLLINVALNTILYLPQIGLVYSRSYSIFGYKK